jgi:hypothetical protein
MTPEFYDRFLFLFCVCGVEVGSFDYSQRRTVDW